tara:strand:- start:1190 stop:1369 length:180 start_codon:yes stop_codon:yes gene_type:complete
MIAKIDRDEHAQDYKHMASYLEAVVSYKSSNTTPAMGCTLDAEEVSNLAWIAERIRKDK